MDPSDAQFVDIIHSDADSVLSIVKGEGGKPLLVGVCLLAMALGLCLIYLLEIEHLLLKLNEPITYELQLTLNK